MRSNISCVQLNSMWLLGAKRRTTTQIKPTPAKKPVAFSPYAAYPPPRYVQNRIEFGDRSWILKQQKLSQHLEA